MEYFNNLIKELSDLKEVSAILLAGSRATNQADEYSDYDIYVYASSAIEQSIRNAIIKKYTSYIEIGNTYWEEEDDGILKNGIPIEIIYRNISMIENVLDEVCYQHKSSVGYSTCIWYNVVNSQVLYDKDGFMQHLINKYKIDYPPLLQRNIINTNLPLLKGKMPAYYNQIDKAIKRNDLVSINHRIAAFLASYFDIILALNRLLHPGEKRLITFIMDNCHIIPKDFEVNLQLLLSNNDPNKLLPLLDDIINNLNSIINI